MTRAASPESRDGDPRDAGEPHQIPPLHLGHLRMLVDDVGIVQHARWAVPLRSSGYCVDDVARLLQVADLLDRAMGDAHWATVRSRALAFLWHAAESDVPGMHNFMSYDRRWIDHVSVGDHVGRTVWALADLIAAGPPAAIGAPAGHVLDRLCAHLALATPSSRTAAYSLLGLTATDALAHRYQRVAHACAEHLVHHYRQHRTASWRWFEPVLHYDNARLSQALIRSGDRFARPDLLDVGLETIEWYTEQCGVEQVVQLPGSRGRRRTEAHPGLGDEQPLDAAALVEAHLAADAATGSPTHRRHAHLAFEWFTGRNRLGRPVYDAATGGCRDGLAGDHVNENEGAESTLAYTIARLRLAAATDAPPDRLPS